MVRRVTSRMGQPWRGCSNRLNAHKAARPQQSGSTVLWQFEVAHLGYVDFDPFPLRRPEIDSNKMSHATRKASTTTSGGGVPVPIRETQYALIRHFVMWAAPVLGNFFVEDSSTPADCEEVLRRAQAEPNPFDWTRLTTYRPKVSRRAERIDHCEVSEGCRPYLKKWWDDMGRPTTEP